MWRTLTNRADTVLAGIARQRELAGWLGGIMFVVVFLWALIGIGMHWAAADHRWIPVRLLYGAWTIAVPLWFFVEYVYCAGASATLSAREEARKPVKAMQEAARPVWAGCAAALGLLLVMVGH